MIKTSHARGRGLACNRKQKKTKKRAETQLTRTEKLISPIWRACREDQSYSLGSSIRRPERHRTSKEKSETSRKVVSREMVCFKIMKLVYNNSIYTKTF